VKRAPQPHNLKALVSRVTMPQGVLIIVSYEQPSGISLAEYFAREDATPAKAPR
jgi:hypothetical protein